MGQPSAAHWARDPASRHDLRWWDGRRWTSYVVHDGRIGKDRSEPTPRNDPHLPAEWYVDPFGRGEARYWDGARWTPRDPRRRPGALGQDDRATRNTRPVSQQHGQPHPRSRQVLPNQRTTSPHVGVWGWAILFFGWLGGLIGYFAVRSGDPRRANHILKWGLIVSLLSILLWSGVIAGLLEVAVSQTSTGSSSASVNGSSLNGRGSSTSNSGVCGQIGGTKVAQIFATQVSEIEPLEPVDERNPWGAALIKQQECYFDFAPGYNPPPPPGETVGGVSKVGIIDAAFNSPLGATTNFGSLRQRVLAEEADRFDSSVGGDPYATVDVTRAASDIAGVGDGAITYTINDTFVGVAVRKGSHIYTVVLGITSNDLHIIDDYRSLVTPNLIALAGTVQ